MTEFVSTGRKRKRRRLLLSVAAVLAIAIIAVASYAYYEFNRKNKDLEGVSPDITTTAAELINKFSGDLKLADSLYKNKVVELTGAIAKIDAADLPVVLFFGEKNSMSSVQCSMDPEHQATYKSLAPGNTARIRGIYIGAISQELFGTDIKLNRCVIIN